MNDVLALILAGGQGDRLSVLSEQRAKPAVVFGGQYRIIDFALSNCANSSINKVAVLTQYRPRSLVNHIGAGRAWGLDAPDRNVEILQPYLGRADMDWYQGTADAVYQNLYLIAQSRAREILVLSADHVYLTSYRNLIAYHRSQRADVTIGVYSVPIDEASRFGVLELDASGRVVDFQEKPSEPKSTWVSMGIYCFDRDVLVEELQTDADLAEASSHDFGKDVVPRIYRDRRVFGYQYHDYWRDVGTVEAYWQANMDLIGPRPPLDLEDPELRLRTSGPVHAPTRFGPQARVSEALVSPAARIDGSVIRSVISPDVVIEEGAEVRDSIICHGCVVRAGAVVDRSILDKEVDIGSGGARRDGRRLDPQPPTAGHREHGDQHHREARDHPRRPADRPQRDRRPGGWRGDRGVQPTGERRDGHARASAPAPLRLMRLYSVEDAQAAVREIRPLLEALRDAYVELRALRAGVAAEARGASADGHAVAGPPADAGDRQRALAATVERVVDGLSERGIEIKDPERGLIDFYHERDGEIVYLCYLLGEDGIRYWHTLTGGFAGRQAL